MKKQKAFGDHVRESKAKQFHQEMKQSAKSLYVILCYPLLYIFYGVKM